MLRAVVPDLTTAHLLRLATERYGMAARTEPSFAGERAQADKTDRLGEGSQDPGGDEPV